MKRNLMKVLAAPSKVASALDWKKARGSKILAVDIGSDRIGMALASHPDENDHSGVRTLEALPRRLEPSNDRKRFHLAQDVVDKFQAIVNNYNVCGFVVSWPIQEEGRCGAPCGLTLHTLDCLIDQTVSTMTSRPMCLWNTSANNGAASQTYHGAGSIRHSASACDEWGRDPLYALAAEPNYTLHIASEEQYAHHKCSSAVAARVWNDFCQTHWPELRNQTLVSEYITSGT